MAQPIQARPQRVPSSRWLMSVLPAFPDLVTVIDATGAVDYVSPSVTALLGHSPDSMIGHRACEFLPDDDVRNAAGWLRHAATHDDAPQLVHRVARSDHTFGWFESSAHRLDGAVDDGLVVVASRDIAARRLADSHLAASALMWRHVADLLVEAVLIVEGNGAIIAGNRRAAGLLGLSQQDLVGRDVGDLLELDAATAAVLDGGGFNASVPLADGRARRVRGRACPLPDDEAAAAAQSTGRVALLVWPAEPTPVPAPGAAPGAPTGPDTQQSRQRLLRPREVEVLRLLAEGMDVREVSTELGISIHTTRNYVKSTLHKLHARTQLQAVVIALRSGLIDLS